jgi:hypothetical protein
MSNLERRIGQLERDGPAAADPLHVKIIYFSGEPSDREPRRVGNVIVSKVSAARMFCKTEGSPNEQ